MAKTLYRIYRPKRFSEIIGQQHVVKTLLNELEHDRLTHAYLFTGPRGVGKTTMARLLARAANSPKRLKGDKDWPEADDAIDNFTIDLIEIDAASHTQVDNVREHIIPNAQTAPTANKYKVFIIDEVHMLSTSAFNALLKIIEEPPETVIFILATTEVHRVPQTIISRCQRFDFHRLTIDEIASRLKEITQKEKVEVDDGVLRTIAIRASGSARDAESLLGQVLSLGEKKITAELASIVIPSSSIESLIDLFETLKTKDVKKAILEINKLVEEGFSMQQFLSDWLEFLRNIILAKTGAYDWDQLPVDDQVSIERVKEFAKDINVSRLSEIINIFQSKQKDIGLSPHPQFPLELAFIQVLDANLEQADGQPPEDIISSPKKPIKETKKKEVKPKTASKIEKPVNMGVNTIEFKSLEKIWPELIKSVSKSNHSLGMILQTCNLTGVDIDNRAVISCAFKLHAERLMVAASHKTIVSKLSELTGKTVGMVALVDADMTVNGDLSQPSNKEEKEITDMVMKTFGNDPVSN